MLVFFDAVGTLLRPREPVAEVYARVGRRYGADLPPAEVGARFRTAFRRQEAADADRGHLTGPERERERWAAIVAEVFRELPDPTAPLPELWAHYHRPDAWICFPDVAPCLERLAARGFRLGLASNADDRMAAVVAGLPELRGLRPVLVSAVLGWRKPSPHFFAALAERGGVPLEEIVMVGDDRANDYLGARAAGCRAVLIDRQAAGPGPEGLTDLQALPAWLEANGPC
jgi:putative hydrolase of the HAD superfamily